MSLKILVTGGCGFVGSNLAIKIREKYPAYEVTAFDNLKRRGSELNIARLQQAGITFIHGDIRNKEDFDPIGETNVVIEAAAEPSVLAGLDSTPEYVINSNLTGTINCLNFALRRKAAVIFLSTSRVYPIERLNAVSYSEAETRFVLDREQTIPGISEQGISEDFPVSGARSFYGTSKLASELFIQEYAEFYGLKAIINRCGVITGPWQMGKLDQGVIVLWLARHFWKGELKYFGFGGEGKQVRDILHIDDLFRLIDRQLHHFDDFTNDIYNAGGGLQISLSLKELTSLCQEITGNRIAIEGMPANRVADIPVYITDNRKITAACGWEPAIRPREILQDVFNWMKENEHSLKSILN